MIHSEIIDVKYVVYFSFKSKNETIQNKLKEVLNIQYLGGKSRISKNISEVINEISGWEIKDSERNCGINQSINQSINQRRLLVCSVALVQ